MSQYEDITHYNSPENSYTPANRTVDEIDTIGIHHWGADGQNFDGVCRFFKSGPGTSAHFVVEAGKCAQLVDIKDIAWHFGNWPANQRSIGIECRPEMSPEDFETVAQVIADIETYYNKSFYIHGHRDFFNTECPGRWYDQLDRLIDRVNAIKEGRSDGAPAPLPKAEVNRIRAEWEKLGAAISQAQAAHVSLGKELG